MGQPVIDEDFDWFDEWGDCDDDCEWCYGEPDYDGMDWDDGWYPPKSPGRLRRLWDRAATWLRFHTPDFVGHFFCACLDEAPIAQAPAHEVNIVGVWQGRELFRYVLQYDGCGGLEWWDSHGQQYLTMGGDFTFQLPDEAVSLTIFEPETIGRRPE